MRRQSFALLVCVTCLPTIGSARSGRDNSELARLRGLVSDPGATISLRQVMDAFLQRPGGGPTPRRVRARQLRDPRYNLVAFRGGDVVVGFYGRKGREDARRNLRMLRRMDARTRRNLVGSLCRKTARSHDYFKRLLAATGNSGKLPRRVLFYVGQDRQYFARAGEKGVYLGYRMLLERYGQVIHHELFHQVARQVLKRGEERFYSATALNEGLADYFAAVACNQPRVAGWRQVKNRFNERDDGQRLRGQSKHHYGQLFSGMLWELRKAINRASGTPWGEVSPADRLALVAFRDRIHESSRKSCDLRGWIDALVATDRALSGGRYLGQIRRVGGRFLGGGFETSR